MLRHIPLLIAALATAASSSGQSIIHTIDKAGDYRQTDTSTVAFNPSIGYTLGSTLEDLTGSTLSSSVPATAPSIDNGTQYDLVWNATRGQWRYESTGYADSASLNAAYANGTYEFDSDPYDNNGSGGVNLSLTGDLYPNAPVISLSSGVWNGGVFQYDPSNALTISSDTFSTNYLDTMSRIEIRIYDGSFFDSTNNNNTGNSLSLELAPYDLTSGSSYTVEIGYSRFIDQQDPTSSGDYYFVTSYTSITALTLQAVPEPGSWSLMAGALALGFVAFCRRRKTTNGVSAG